MIDIKFTAAGADAIKKVQQKLERLERQYVRKIGEDMKPVLKKGAQAGKLRIAAKFFSGGRRLQSAFTSAVRIMRDNIDARLGYVRRRSRAGRWAWLGRIYETGATVTPKKARYLWVPVGDNRREGNAPVITAKQYFEQFQGSGVIRRSTAGNLIAFKAGEFGLIPMFTLKDQTTVPARPVLENTVDETLPRVREAAAVTLFDNYRKP